MCELLFCSDRFLNFKHHNSSSFKVKVPFPINKKKVFPMSHLNQLSLSQVYFLTHQNLMQFRLSDSKIKRQVTGLSIFQSISNTNNRSYIHQFIKGLKCQKAVEFTAAQLYPSVQDKTLPDGIISVHWLSQKKTSTMQVFSSVTRHVI